MTEKKGFRDNVERIKAMFPDKELLTKSDVVRFCGINYRTVVKMFPFTKQGFISVATLARELSV